MYLVSSEIYVSVIVVRKLLVGIFLVMGCVILHESVAPAFPVLESCDNVAFIVLFSRTRLLIFCETTTDAETFVGSEKASGIGPVEDHPPAESTHKHCCETFEEETEGERSQHL